MTIPSTIDTQFPINAIGIEQKPFTIILNGSMWMVFSYGDNVVLREYDSPTILHHNLIKVKDFYTISNSYASGSISTDTFWLWTVRDENLYVRDIQPISIFPPIIGSPILVESGVTACSPYIREVEGIYLLLLDKTVSARNLFLRQYDDITQPPTREQLGLDWPVTALDEININVWDEVNFDSYFLDTSSPPNVYQNPYTGTPEWIPPYPQVSVIENESVEIEVNVDTTGIVYGVVLPDGSPAPTSEQVKSGYDSQIPVTKNAIETIIFSSLIPGTSYDFYIVAESSSLVLQANPTLLEATTTIPIPEWIPPYPQVSLIEDNSVDIEVRVDSDGTVYGMVLPNGSPAPTSAEVKAGYDSQVPVVDDVVNTITFSSLAPGTDYDIYIVAENAYTLQANPTLFDVTTTVSIPSWIVSPYFEIPPSVGTRQTYCEVRASTDIESTAYLMVLDYGTAPDPTSEQVKNGIDPSTSLPVQIGRHDSVSLLPHTLNPLGSFYASDLEPGTLYDVWVVAEGTSGLQANPIKLEYETSSDFFIKDGDIGFGESFTFLRWEVEGANSIKLKTIGGDTRDVTNLNSIKVSPTKTSRYVLIALSGSITTEDSLVVNVLGQVKGYVN